MRAALSRPNYAIISGAAPAVSALIFSLFNTQIHAQNSPAKPLDPTAQPFVQSAAQKPEDSREKQVQIEREKNRLQQRITLTEQRLKNLSQEQLSKDANSRYASAKAQCWLDFSRHEDLRNNPTRAPELAWLKSRDLVEALEGKQALTERLLDSELREESADKASPANTEKPAPRLRADLWAQLGAISSNPGMSCAAKQVACTQVMLVQAEHAHQRIDWRYAQPYFGMAEDGVKEAKKIATSCKN